MSAAAPNSETIALLNRRPAVSAVIGRGRASVACPNVGRGPRQLSLEARANSVEVVCNSQRIAVALIGPARDWVYESRQRRSTGQPRERQFGSHER